jgi:hypothetical protein
MRDAMNMKGAVSVPSRWGGKIPMPGVFLICMAMSGSGVPTGMATILPEALPILKVPLRVPIGWFGAVAGTVLLQAADRPIAADLSLESGTSAVGSGWPPPCPVGKGRADGGTAPGYGLAEK